MTIPLIIHRMWVQGLPLPEQIAAMMGTWREHHPFWEFRFWHKNNLPELVNQDLWDRAHEISPSAPEQFRSDVARYEILLQFGGVWVDADFVCQKPIDDLMYVDCFAGLETPRWLNNALIGAPAGHPMLYDLVAKLPASVKRTPITQGNAVRSGPQFFTPIARRHGITEYPQRYFYPYAYNRLEQGLRPFPDSYAVHHWGNQRRLRGIPLGGLA